MQNKLISFINKQTHYKAGEDLDIARNNTLIFGTYNPPKDLGYINNYRFSINNNKNNFLNFSKLLYEQTYNKLLNPEYRTIPVGIELNGLRKIVIDIDTVLSRHTAYAIQGTKCKLISWEHFNYYQHPNVKYRKYTRKLAGRFANAIITFFNADFYSVKIVSINKCYCKRPCW